MYANVYVYVCMVFANIWRFKAPSESKVVPYDSHVNSTLLRHVFSAVVTPARAWHVIEVPIGLTLWSGQLPPQLHVILAQILS